MEKLTEIKSRLLQFAKSQGFNKEKFYQKIGIDGANFRGKNANSELGSEKIVSILTIFPELNSDWLLLGKGEMLRKNGEKTAEKEGETAETAEFLEIIKQQQETINRLLGMLNISEKPTLCRPKFGTE